MEGSQWTKPNKKIKLKRTAVKPMLAKVEQSERMNLSLPIISDEDRKRRNPFAQEIQNIRAQKNKRIKINGESDEAAANSSSPFSSSSAFSRLSSTSSTNSHESRDSGVDSQSSHLFSPLFNDKENEAEEPTLHSLEEFPVDWSLKSRAIFTSSQRFSWGSHLSTVEAASGITGGVRCLDIGSGNHCLDTSPSTQFHSCCVYWQHPAIPGARLFPRYSQSTIGKGERLSMSPEMERCIHADWVESLQSVYQLVKVRQCPYFYVCAPSFTCLFRAAGIFGSQQIIALVSPTSSGIRSAFKREDVEFTMPLVANKKDDDLDEEKEEGEARRVRMEETTEFLESLGIEANSLPGLTNNNPKNRAQLGVTIDGRSESLVFVEGVECQSLLNYLLNAKLTQGVGGLPPTILAPVAFHGASLRTLKVKEFVTGGKGGLPKSYQLDLKGPILPHMLMSLVQLSTSHLPSFSMSLHTLEDTVAFSLFNLPKESVAPSAFAAAGLKDSGLVQNVLDYFIGTRKVSEDGGQEDIVREAEFSLKSFRLTSRDSLSKQT